MTITTKPKPGVPEKPTPMLWRCDNCKNSSGNFPYYTTCAQCGEWRK